MIVSLFTAGLLLGTPQSVETCGVDDAYCILDIAISHDIIQSRLGDADEVYWTEGTQVFVAARRESDSAFLCCAIQEPMRQVENSEYWYLVIDVPRLDEAFIDIVPIPYDEPGRSAQLEALEYRGENAPLPVGRVPVAEADISERTIVSPALGQNRRFSVYTPQEIRISDDRRVVYIADGQSTGAYAQIVQSLLETCQIEPILLVGLWHGDVNEDISREQTSEQRSQDYLWAREGNHFEAHEAFFLNEVIPLVEEEFAASSDPNRRALFGMSSGAAWALTTGLRNPSQFGAVGAVSTVWPRSLGAASPQRGPTFYLSSGLFEEGAQLLMGDIAHRLSESGVMHQQQTFISGHSPLVAYHAFVQMLVEEFPIENGGQCGESN